MPVKPIANKAEFDAAIKDEKYAFVAIDFYADWCGPCKMIKPVFHELAGSDDYKDKALFLEVNVDEAEDVATECGISAMPTFQFYVKGEKKEQLMGANGDKLKELVKKLATPAEEPAAK